MTIKAQVALLNGKIDKLKSGDKRFAQSLIQGYWRKGRLTQPQQLWVDKLIARADEQAELPLFGGVTPVVQIAADFTKLQELFNRAAANGIETPRIRMDMPDGRRLLISKAHPYSHNRGHIYVRLSDSYYGKVDMDGRLTLAPGVDSDLSVHSILEEIITNPSAAGAVHGRRTGRCVFCGRELTNHISLHYGYGPICASKWDLAWSQEEVVQDFASVDKEELSKQLLSRF